MKVAFFDTHGFEQPIFQKANQTFHQEITFFETRVPEYSPNAVAEHTSIPDARSY